MSVGIERVPFEIVKLPRTQYDPLHFQQETIGEGPKIPLNSRRARLSSCYTSSEDPFQLLEVTRSSRGSSELFSRGA